MPYKFPQQQYQSMFVPMDLGVIQQNLGQRQQRYDATSTALAQAKAGLYDMDTYDPTQKAAMIKMVEDRFGDIYSRHSGDLGAAATDVMDTIADIRSHPYFSLNKAALEKQKQQEALIQQYGPDALKFATLPQGLSADGKWRSQGEFGFDIEKSLDYAQRVGQIWQQTLKDVSRESPPGIVGGMLVSTTRSGIGTFGQTEGEKLEAVKREYKTTSEYTQQKKKLMHPNYGDLTEEQAEEAIDKFIKDSGKARKAPESIRYDTRNIPSSVSGVGGPGEGYYYRGVSMTSYLDIKRQFNKPREILSAADSDDNSQRTFEAKKRRDRVLNSTGMQITKDQIVKLAMEIGTDPDKMFKSSGKAVIYREEGGGPGFIGRPAPKGTKAQIKEINSLVNKYNEFLDIGLTKTIDGGYEGFQWNDFNLGRAYREGYARNGTEGAKAAVDAQTAREAAVRSEVAEYPMEAWIYDISDYAGKTEFTDDERKVWRNPESVWVGHDPAKGVFALNIRTTDGKSHIVRPTNLLQALTVAETYGDPGSIGSAIGSVFEFGSNSMFKLKNGKYEETKLPEGIELIENYSEDPVESRFNGTFTLVDNGIPVQIQTSDGPINRPMAKHEVAIYLHDNYGIIPEFDKREFRNLIYGI